MAHLEMSGERFGSTRRDRRRATSCGPNVRLEALGGKTACACGKTFGSSP